MEYYFSELDELRCFPLKDILADMEEQGIKELKVTKAKMVVGEDYFYCTEFQDAGQIGEGCGKFCEKYQPRNGKNGRCRFSANCYEPTDITKIIRNKKEK